MPRKPTNPTSIQGFGCIFRPKYPDRKNPGEKKTSAVWWVKYKTRDGFVRKSTGRTDQREAFNELMKLAGRSAIGEIVDSAPERVTIGQLLDLLIQDYEIHEKKTLEDARLSVEKHLRPYFGDTRAADLTTAKLDAFVVHMKRLQVRPGDPKRYEPATINRVLSLLRRALKLGAKRTPPLVLRVPDFPMFKVDNARQGTFDHDTYTLLRDQLWNDLEAKDGSAYANKGRAAALVLVIGYHVGMRRGEILGLKWEQVDVARGVINLEAKQTKNQTRRQAPIYGTWRWPWKRSTRVARSWFSIAGVASTRSKRRGTTRSRN
jgi:integrase